MRRDAFQVAFLARLLAEDYEKGATYSELENRLSRISSVAEQILVRATPEQADSLTPMIETQTDTISICDEESDAGTMRRMVQLLEPVAQGITLTIRADETADGLSEEVQKTVASFRTRSRERGSQGQRAD